MRNGRGIPDLPFKSSSREKLDKLLRAKSLLLFFSVHARTHSLIHAPTRAQ